MTEPTNFIYQIIQFEKNVSKILKNNKRDDSITINKKKLIKKFITDSLKSAYFAALNTAENDLDEITNASGNDIPTQGIRIAMQKLFNELKSSATTRRQIVIRFELKKDELDYFGKELDNFVCPELPNPGDEKRIGNKDGYGKTNSYNFIYIYNAYNDFTWKCIKTINGNCEYKFAYFHCKENVPNSGNL